MSAVLPREGFEVEFTGLPAELDTINTTFTNRCNLRCIYCPEGTHPEDYYADMAPPLFNEILDLGRAKKLKNINISFYGESMHYSEWYKYATAIMDAGIDITMGSNFARLATPEEIPVLARMKQIRISVDTDDIEILRKIRRSMDLRTVIYNVLKVRGYCIAHDMPVPDMLFACVLSDKVVSQVSDLVSLCVALGIPLLTFNEVVEIGDSPGGLRNIAELEGQELADAIRYIEEGLALAKRLGLKTYFAEPHLARIYSAAAGTLSKDSEIVHRMGVIGVTYGITADSLDRLPEGKTRMCLSPWVNATIDPKGKVFACCVSGQVMGVIGEDGSLAEIMENDAYRDLRTQLLTGHGLNDDCALCPLIPQTEPERLRAKVSRLRW